jgi:hypothetical protein
MSAGPDTEIECPRKSVRKEIITEFFICPLLLMALSPPIMLSKINCIRKGHIEYVIKIIDFLIIYLKYHGIIENYIGILENITGILVK